MYWDREERKLWLLHSSLGIRSPVTFDWRQAKLALGFTCPRHRRLLKQNLCPLGRLIPYREWSEDGNTLVSVWDRAEADRGVDELADLKQPE